MGSTRETWDPELTEVAGIFGGSMKDDAMSYSSGGGVSTSVDYIEIPDRAICMAEEALPALRDLLLSPACSLINRVRVYRNGTATGSVTINFKGLPHNAAAAFHEVNEAIKPKGDSILDSSSPFTQALTRNLKDLARAARSRSDKACFGSVLWIHPVFHIVCSENLALESFVKSVSSPHLSVAIPTQGGQYVPGVGCTSIISYSSRQTVNLEVILQLIDAMWSNYALFLKVARNLDSALNRIRGDRTISAGEVSSFERLHTEVKAQRVLAESWAAYRGGDCGMMWRTTSEVQAFEPLMQLVDDKLAVVLDYCRTVRDASNSKASNRANMILVILSALNFIGLGIAVYGFVFVWFDQIHGPTPMSLLITALLGGLAGILACVALWRGKQDQI